MKRVLTGMVLAGLSLSAPGMAAQTQQWTCSWAGSWGVGSEPGQDGFSMLGFMYPADGGLAIRANASERAGDSRVRASCLDGQCKFEQKFPDPAGSTYFSMIIEETIQGPDETVTRYRGSWGEEEDPETHEGNIAFTGTCKPLKLKQPGALARLMNKVLGWDDESYEPY